MSDILCYLHEEEDEHWIDPRDRVAVWLMDDGVVRRDQNPVPASRVCVRNNGVEADRVDGNWGGPWA